MARLSSVFIADPDPRGLDALAYAFVGEGFQVSRAPTLESAPAAISAANPQVIVIAVAGNLDAGLALLRALGAANNSRPTPPVIALGPASAHAEIRSVPGVEFLPAPVFVRDVITASKILAAMQPSEGGAPEDRSMQGTLSEYGVFFLLRTLIGLGRSGLIQVERANRKGEIRLRSGEVIAAQVGSVQGFPALHQLLLWEEAALDVRFRSVVRPGQLQKKADDLIDEAQRFLRDFAHASKDLGPPGTIFSIEQENAPKTARIPPEVLPVVRLIDGKRTMGGVIEDSPFRVLETVRIISRLLEIGVLHTAQAAAQPRLDGWVKSTSNESVIGNPEAPSDGRSGSANRRKSPRKRTSGQVPSVAPPAPAQVADNAPTTPSSAAPPTTSAPVAAAPGVVAPAPTTRARAAGSASGLQVHGEIQSSVRQKDPTARSAPTPSVVIDANLTERPPAALPKAASMASAANTSNTSLTVRGTTRVLGSKRAPPSGAKVTSGPSIEVEAGLTSDTVPAPTAQLRSKTARNPTPAGGSRKSSGEFDAVESDFFARESDLYKPEPVESFDDLDEGHPTRTPRPRTK